MIILRAHTRIIIVNVCDFFWCHFLCRNHLYICIISYRQVDLVYFLCKKVNISRTDNLLGSGCSRIGYFKNILTTAYCCLNIRIHFIIVFSLDRLYSRLPSISYRWYIARVKLVHILFLLGGYFTCLHIHVKEVLKVSVDLFCFLFKFWILFFKSFCSFLGLLSCYRLTSSSCLIHSKHRLVFHWNKIVNLRLKLFNLSTEHDHFFFDFFFLLDALFNFRIILLALCHICLFMSKLFLCSL